jgi:hypothetical protein
VNRALSGQIGLSSYREIYLPFPSNSVGLWKQEFSICGRAHVIAISGVGGQRKKKSSRSFLGNFTDCIHQQEISYKSLITYFLKVEKTALK